MPLLKSFQLLEINVISAQDLEPMSRKMKTRATAWVHPARKLSTRVDTEGHVNPNWNDKFVFRVDDEFLKIDTSAVMIEIYATNRGRWKRDLLVGTVRVLVGNLIPPPSRSNHPSSHHIGMRFVALQVRRPSGRPQGILNLSVSVLDSTMRSMPLYSQLSASAVGFHHLLEEVEQHDKKADQTSKQSLAAVKPILQRSRSERSVTFDKLSSVDDGSMVAFPNVTEGRKRGISILNSEFSEPLLLKTDGKKGKASSVISGAELKEKSKGRRGKKGGSSVLSDSIVSKESLKNDIILDLPVPFKIEPNNKIKFLIDKLGIEQNNDNPVTSVVEETPVTGKNSNTVTTGKNSNNNVTTGKPASSKYNTKSSFLPPPKAGSVVDSEIGPSPSEVAAAISLRRYPLDDDRSSMLDGWSADESVEGLRAKLERWRSELPPLYDRGEISSSSFRSTSQHSRRHTVGGETGLFSCFGKIAGIECQCVCGKPPSKDGGSYGYASP
ncbi:C2 domain-containing protein [Heracleum sosnowskyi]|uniref:C2 domain-containing protein n=1 Tax=Heracleum sosnowskyi TaxID=360622 RepID=A0AAD8IT42_9APIA|nr:C2 domain-containing protein [Heracleum sosnowskyi]